MIALLVVGTVLVVITWGGIEWALWLNRYIDWRDAQKKLPRQIPLDDALGTENYNGPLG